MRTTLPFNHGWIFDGRDPVTLPHSAVELPFSHFNEAVYQRPFTYTRRFTFDPAWQGREVSVVFDGVMADARVSLNGHPVTAHRDGYTPFEARLTPHLRPAENELVVTLDGSENPDIPPFGALVDYLTYAGIYRDVWLRVTAPVHIANVRVETPDPLAAEKQVVAQVEIADPAGLGVAGLVHGTILDAAGQLVATTAVEVTGPTAELRCSGLAGIRLWDIADPALYTLSITLETAAGSDVWSTRFGLRSARFEPDGFYLNGKKLKLVGLNRHQSFPYSGYALGRAAQERDAEILKRDLGLNMVRTSHYPQSPWFLDRCDELGLLVFEEIPGWQHIGGTQWQRESVENVRRMIRRDWNHPSIVIWGVRINESHDSHEFYAETNRVARELDPTRQTGGVRCYTDSELLEDVYTMNDFILGLEERGGNRPRTALRPRAEVTGLAHPVPYLVTEYSGHMFPTKVTDQEQRQIEHVTRHLDVLDAAFGDPEVTGVLGWCAFDYNTHKDFGSGDHICHHGVMDMFREPKFAAFAYSSQRDPAEAIVMKPVTLWANGERNIGGVLPLMVLTNCDEIELRYGDHPPKRLGPDRDRFPHLPHPPVIFESRHFTEGELGIWGDAWVDGMISGYRNGEKVAEHILLANPVATALSVVPDRTEIGASDSLRVVITAHDQAGNPLAHFSEPVAINVAGPARRLGPRLVPLRAGKTGFWLTATGSGEILVAVESERLGTVTVAVRAV